MTKKNAAKTAARRLQASNPGLSYQAALRQVTKPSGEPNSPDGSPTTTKETPNADR